LLLGWAALVLARLEMAAVGAERAVVQGVNALNVRRGPGTEHRSFALLTEGQEVEVLRIEGVWAVVRVPGGAEGYVRKEHLSFKAGSASEAGVADEVKAETSGPPPPSDTDDVRALREENARLSAELALLRAQSAAAPATPLPEVPVAREPARLQEDMQRLLQLTGELHDMVAAQGGRHGAPASGAAPDEPWILANGWVVAASALLGGLAGAAYGRIQERRRRTRIRF